MAMERQTDEQVAADCEFFAESFDRIGTGHAKGTATLLRESASRLRAPRVEVERIRALIAEWRQREEKADYGDDIAIGYGVCANQLERLLASAEAENPRGDYTEAELNCPGCMGPCGRCEEPQETPR